MKTYNMIKKLTLIFLLSTSVSIGFAQSSICGPFHKRYCKFDSKDKGFQYNAQSRSGLFNQGSTSKIRCVVYKGMEYRIAVCCETAVGSTVNFKIFDGKTKELLFDNSQEDNLQSFEFESASSRVLDIEVTVPEGETEEAKGKPVDAACVGLLIEHKISPRKGFSKY
jgi:hypothetical protein